MRTHSSRRAHLSSFICPQCGAADVIEIGLTLPDDTEVDFRSCHRCEYRWWNADGEVIDLTVVLDKARPS